MDSAKTHIWECVPNAPYKLRISLTEELKKVLIDRLSKNKRCAINQINHSPLAEYGKVKVHFS